MGIYRTEEKGIPMTMVTATPPASIANAGTSDNRNVLLSVRDVQKVYGSRLADLNAFLERLADAGCKTAERDRPQSNVGGHVLLLRR